MRVITGSARGHRLGTLEGEDVRPTSEKVKEAVFSMIQFELEGRHILDLFAGSGQLGIEALSRGAASCVFIDSSRDAAAMVTANIAAVKFQTLSTVVVSDAVNYIRTTGGRFDIAFIDPPYNHKLIDAVLPYVAAKMSPAGVIVCESDYREVLPETAGSFAAVKKNKYGKTLITIYRVPGAGEDEI